MKETFESVNEPTSTIIEVGREMIDRLEAIRLSRINPKILEM